MDLSMLPVAPIALAAGFVVTLIAATLQGTIGFGFAVLSVPVLSLVDPALAPVPQLLVAFPLTLAMAFRERHALDLRGVWWILLGRVPGAALGVLLLKLADSRAVDVVLAFFVLVAVGIIASGASVKRTTGTQVAAGVASGTFAVVSSIGGPPLALLYRDADGATVRASLAAIFFFGIFITIFARTAASEISWRDVHIAVYLMPALLLGLIASRRLAGKVEGRPLKLGILIVSSIAAVGLLVRAALI